MFISSLKNEKRASSVKRPVPPPPKPPAASNEKAIWSSVSLQQHYTMDMRVTTTNTFPSRQRPPPPPAPPRGGAGNARNPILTTTPPPRSSPPPQHQQHTAPQNLPQTRYISRKALEAAAAMGLVEIPPPPPAKEEWEVILAKQRVRVVEEKAGDYSCSICMERFITDSNNPQVLLDCSHVFHKTCLEQFEKFICRAREKKACPLCRKTHYHKKVLVEGPAQLRALAAVKIQSLFRGVIARKRCQKLQWKANPVLAADYAYEQLKGISDKYLARAVAREKEVDDIIERMDLERQKALADLMNKRDWEAIRARILLRAVGAGDVDNGCHHHGQEDYEDDCGVDCPICLAPVVGSDGVEHSTNSAVMLSCSHFFHRPCLDSFERIQQASGSSSGTVVIPRCPVCRAAYAKMAL